MKKCLFFSIVMILCFSLSSCVSKSEYEKLENKIKNLEQENIDVKNKMYAKEKELAVYKYSPEKMLATAQAYYDDDELDSLRDIKVKLEYYHPESKKEVSEVNALLEKLQTARELRAKEAQRKKMQAVDRLKKEYDDVSGTTWYYNPYFTHYNNSNRTSIYIGKKSSTVWLRLLMSYTGSDWIFFENAYLSYDGNTLQIPFNEYDNKKTEIGSGKVWEWIDVSVNYEILDFLRKMIKGKSVKMRLSGKYAETRNLSSSEIKGIEAVLMAYDVLNKGVE